MPFDLQYINVENLSLKYFYFHFKNNAKSPSISYKQKNMNDLLRDISTNTKLYDVQSAAGHILLVADMCFFVASIIDAQMNYQTVFHTSCSLNVGNMSIETATTLGYIIRLIFTAILLIAKIINLYKFIARTNVFPKVGALYAPFMSSVLLTVIIYDFDNCSKVSHIFSLESSLELSGIYSVIILAVLIGLVSIKIITYVQKRSQRYKIFTVLTLLLTLCIIVGSLIGLISEIEILRNDKPYAFVLFDLYSFCIALVFLGVTEWKRFKVYIMRIRPST
ncbi:unnamed protein product [Blepharisma stoltei]|uniref:Uncharacterized protein n=1 Tax=Blepharisma stoltei TaxID=1481888 RepID=A0AAU9IPD4_9CILI|nr:unnamed protein product [Blepharisma stoltei]